MSDVTIISAGGALVGSGTWFAAKLFGPSADALGNQLKAYLTARIESIFARAGQVAADNKLELSPVPAGLLARMIADASFSEDSDEITCWWANLFVDASLYSSNRHAVFSDIMAFVGPAEARCLDDILSEYLDSDLVGMHASRSLSSLAISIVKKDTREWFPNAPIIGLPLHEKLHKSIDEYDSGLPIKLLELEFPFSWRSDSDEATFRSMSTWYSANAYSVDILRRSSVIDILECRPDSSLGRVTIGCPTTLGIDFYKACKGRVSDEH